LKNKVIGFSPIVDDFTTNHVFRPASKQSPLVISNESQPKSILTRSSSLPHHNVAQSDKCNSPIISSQYNPSSYSSEKASRSNPLREITNNTPVNSHRSSGMKQVIPRAVNFHSQSPINVMAKNSSALKENEAFEDSHNGSSSRSLSQSYQSPDRFMCQMITSRDEEISRLRESAMESKDQQIKQLQNDLAKKEEQLQKFLNNFLSSSKSLHEVSVAPKITSNTFATQTENRETRSIGTNTDIVWSDLLDSVKDEELENENNAVGRSSCQASSVVLKSVVYETQEEDDVQGRITSKETRQTLQAHSTDGNYSAIFSTGVFTPFRMLSSC